ncbi:sortase [Patescibacteria group bacterium]|nr:sortase [Patescibacteria group bacterium]MBU1755257.1 sortase [Patescibacteria group bacterium]
MSQKTAGFIRAVQKAYSKKFSFLAAFLVVFFVTFSVLVRLDVVPEVQVVAETPMVSLAASPLVATGTVAKGNGELPVRVEIPSIGVKATVANPSSTDIAVLDTELLKGAVRYPTSAKLGEEGNVILMGHSSYLPVVHNQAFKAFNEIQKLKVGEEIMVYAEGTTYVYAVEKVVEADAKSAAIPLTATGSKLTLATCDSFGDSSGRFIVTATLVESYPSES